MALPSIVSPSTPVGSEGLGLGDDQIRALKLALTDIFGIPVDTAIAAALFTVIAAGLKSVNFQDAAANPAAAGVLQRNGITLRFHDGAGVRTLILSKAGSGGDTLGAPLIISPGGLTSQDVGAGGNPVFIARAHPTLDVGEIGTITNHAQVFITNGTARGQIDGSGLVRFLDQSSNAGGARRVQSTIPANGDYADGDITIVV